MPREALALAVMDEGELSQSLVTHPDVDRVILTGSWDTARLFRSWRPELPLMAETSGKNAIVVTPSADRDRAVADIVRSAFGMGGQKCSALSRLYVQSSVADELIDRVASNGRMEVIHDFAYKLPTLVMCDMLGIDPLPWEWERFVMFHASFSVLRPKCSASAVISRSLALD